jgi:hypothetical protein
LENEALRWLGDSESKQLLRNPRLDLTMSLPPIRRLNIGTFVDLAVLCGAWAIGGWAVIEVDVGDVRWLVIVLLLCAPMNALYLQIRLTPRLLALVDLRRREEMALTMISPHDYLWPRLKWPLLLAAAPVGTLIIPLGVGLLVMYWDDIDVLMYVGGFESFFFLTLYCFVLYAMLFIAIAGALDLLVRLCRRRSPVGASLFLIPAAW